MKHTKKIGSYDIPFNNKGNQLHYPGDAYGSAIVWTDTLIIENAARGRSAAYFILKSTTTGCEYTMFFTDAFDLMLHTLIDHGKITANWCFCKRGQNYGIMLAPDVAEP